MELFLLLALRVLNLIVFLDHFITRVICLISFFMYWYFLYGFEILYLKILFQHGERDALSNLMGLEVKIHIEMFQEKADQLGWWGRNVNIFR